MKRLLVGVSREAIQYIANKYRQELRRDNIVNRDKLC